MEPYASCYRAAQNHPLGLLLRPHFRFTLRMWRGSPYNSTRWSFRWFAQYEFQGSGWRHSRRLKAEPYLAFRRMDELKAKIRRQLLARNRWSVTDAGNQKPSIVDVNFMETIAIFVSGVLSLWHDTLLCWVPPPFHRASVNPVFVRVWMRCQAQSYFESGAMVACPTLRGESPPRWIMPPKWWLFMANVLVMTAGWRRRPLRPFFARLSFMTNNDVNFIAFHLTCKCHLRPRWTIPSM